MWRKMKGEKGSKRTVHWNHITMINLQDNVQKWTEKSYTHTSIMTLWGWRKDSDGPRKQRSLPSNCKITWSKKMQTRVSLWAYSRYFGRWLFVHGKNGQEIRATGEKVWRRVKSVRGSWGFDASTSSSILTRQLDHLALSQNQVPLRAHSARARAHTHFLRAARHPLVCSLVRRFSLSRERAGETCAHARNHSH